jgi:hypothetical protein
MPPGRRDRERSAEVRRVRVVVEREVPEPVVDERPAEVPRAKQDVGMAADDDVRARADELGREGLLDRVGARIELDPPVQEDVDRVIDAPRCLDRPY